MNVPKVASIVVAALCMVQMVLGHNCTRCKDGPMDISFVMDSSSSVGADSFHHGMDFIVHLMEHFTIGQDAVRASFISFGGHSYDPNEQGYQKGAIFEDQAIYFKDSVNNKALTSALKSVTYIPKAYTNTSAGIEFALNHQMTHSRDAANLHSVMVVITDGKSQDGDLTAAESQRARDQGITVFAVGVGSDVDTTELRVIGGKSSNVKWASSYKELSEKLGDKVTNMICDDDEGEDNSECRAIPVDLMFVIDSSASIEAEGGRGTFKKALQFLSSIVEYMQVDNGLARVAAVQYAKGVRADDAIKFGDYKTKSSLQQAILGLKYYNPAYGSHSGSQTETGKGIDYARENFMSDRREGAVRAMVVITDGRSNYGTNNAQSVQQTLAAANRARKAGATIFSIGVGDKIDMYELQGIADGNSQVIRAHDYNSLNKIRDDLKNTLCWTAVDLIQKISN